MEKYCIQLNEEGFCIGSSIFDQIMPGFIEVPEAIYPTDISHCGQKFDIINMRWLDEYADWYVPPIETKPEPSPQEKIISLLERQQQSELDKDEIMIDQLITAEEIKLALENTNKFSGGGYKLTCNPHQSSVWGCVA